MSKSKKVSANDWELVEENSFRISVLLNRFFEDERAKCYMLVQGRRPVKWLHRRLRRLFGLPRHFCLLSRGHLLPQDEPLALLTTDDLVEVIPVSRDCNWSLIEKSNLTFNDNKNQGQKRNQNDTDAQNMIDKVVYNDELRFVNHNNVSTFSVSNNSTDSQISENMTSDTSLPEDMLKEIKKQAIEILNQYEANIEPKTGAMSSLMKRKRRRVRRRKPQVADEYFPSSCDKLTANVLSQEHYSPTPLSTDEVPQSNSDGHTLPNSCQSSINKIPTHLFDKSTSSTAPTVVQNNVVETREPRVVQCLDM